MATATTEKETSDVFNCSICLERFTKPKYLPCLHTFCEACLNTYILSTKSADKPGYFPCPVCRQEVKSPNPKAPREEWAKSMPVNHMIYSLMESSATDMHQKEAKCKSCEREEECIAAEFWCIDCREYLCVSCKKYHMRNKLCVTHKVKHISELEKSDIVVHIPETEEPCPDHTGEVLKVYCQDHKEMCCVICLSINHRKCEDIKTFDQMAESIAEGNGHLEDKLKEIGLRAKSLLDKKQQNINRIETQQQHILKEVYDLVEKAKNNLDEGHKEFRTHFLEVHKENSTKLAHAKDRIEYFQKTLFTFESTLKTALEHGSPKHVFITCEKIKKQLTIQSNELVDFFKDDKNIEYTVNIDENLTAVTTKKSLAKVQVKTNSFSGLSSLDIDICSLVYSENESTEIKRQLKMANIAELGVTKLWDVNGDGWFTGGTFLHDGRLLCADNKKKSLNVFDQDGNVQIVHPLDYQPWDVAQHSDGRIVVTNYTAKSIRSYILSNETLNDVGAVIQLQSTPYEIEVLDDQTVIETGGQIHIMTQEGKIVKRLSTTKNNQCFAKSMQSGKEPRFFFCRGKDVILKTVDVGEIQKHSLVDLKLLITNGIALDCAENIYVCDWLSNNVFIISKDFQSSCILMSRKSNVCIGYPFAIGFDKSGTKFFISGSNNGVLAVYKMCLKK